MSASTYTPLDDFPPHGYLDNPAHSWKLHPSGVLRSRLPAGMGWHVPNHGSYAHNQFAHRTHLFVGIEAAGRRLLTPADFRAARIPIGCDLHTKNRLRYVWIHPAGVRVAATYFLVGDDALGCLVELSRLTPQPPSRTGREPAGPGSSAAAPPSRAREGGWGVRLWLAQELAHNSATSRLWEHGIYAALPGAHDPATGPAGLLGICPEGGAWAHGAADGDSAPLAPAKAIHEAAPWPGDVPDAREPDGLQTAILLLAYDLEIPPGSALAVHSILARGVSADRALATWRDALAAFDASLVARASEDERFWAVAPRLSGDWPAHWRRGLATDLETLRMTVRPPAGIFGRPWDGMQIQAPRAVLAETALDALALAWADPALARGILLECFAAAPRPNVPCLREDGSYNMVADDGAVCGTGPEWGWPLAAADALWRRTGDRDGLAALYPYAAAYLSWWLSERSDGDGWLVHACSWESGQDVSARFGAQQTGGSDVRHLRPVDLQAAVAQGCALLAEWAETLGQPPAEVARWRSAAARVAEQTRALWRTGWYHDFDARERRWSDVRDPMQLAPLACGLATPEQIAALRPAFAALPPHGGTWPPLVWPPVAHTALEAALATGLDARAAELAAQILEHAWRRMDARDLEPDGALPGVTREFWPAGGPTPSAGIEGYGWGALTAHFLVRYVVGLREIGPASFRLIPAVPPARRLPGAAYTLGPLAYGPGALTLSYRIPVAAAHGALDVDLALTGAAGAYVARDEQDGRELARGAPDASGALRLAWRGAWQRATLVRAES
jgi:Trehalase